MRSKENQNENEDKILKSCQICYSVLKIKQKNEASNENLLCKVFYLTMFFNIKDDESMAVQAVLC